MSVAALLKCILFLVHIIMIKCRSVSTKITRPESVATGKVASI